MERTNSRDFYSKLAIAVAMQLDRLRFLLEVLAKPLIVLEEATFVFYYYYFNQLTLLNRLEFNSVNSDFTSQLSHIAVTTGDRAKRFIGHLIWTIKAKFTSCKSLLFRQKLHHIDRN